MDDAQRQLLDLSGAFWYLGCVFPDLGVVGEEDFLKKLKFDSEDLGVDLIAGFFRWIETPKKILPRKASR